MGLTHDLLVVLSSYHGGYRLMRRRMREFTGEQPSALKQYSESTLRVTLSRLKKRGLVENKAHKWFLTSQGKLTLRKIMPHAQYAATELNKKNPNNMIIAFDIPEQNRRKRDWLRSELVIMNFKILQKSVWFGPSPLPKKFIDILQDLKLLQFIKFFKAEEHDIV